MNAISHSRATAELLARRICRRSGEDPDMLVTPTVSPSPLWTPVGLRYPVPAMTAVPLWRTYEALAHEMLSGGLP